MNTASDYVVTAQDRECKCFNGFVIDSPDNKKDTARTVARWIREGRLIGRLSSEDIRAGTVRLGHTCGKRGTP